MKKYLLILFAIYGFQSISAQSGYNSVNLTYGLSLDQSEEITIAYEFNYKYFNSWEIIFIGVRDRDINYEEFNFGLVFEPILLKHNDFMIHFRAGGTLGSNYDKVIFGPLAGFEASYYIMNRLQLIVQQSNYFTVNDNQRFRHALTGGIKFQF